MEATEEKVCNRCKESKSLSEFYSQKKVNKEGSEYVYYRPDCKECASKKACQWGKENKERKYKSNDKYNKTERNRLKGRERNNRYKKKGKRKDWEINNKDKLYLYGKKHRKHEINTKEWLACKMYFNNSCAYCSMSYDDHKRLYKQDLHREHVHHDGANDLSNCVPACRNCNTQKRDFDFDKWFNEDNIRFSMEKLEKINLWLDEDYIAYKH